MTESRALYLYDAACLAGGTDRVVDTALTVLLESGRVRAQRTGELSVVEAVRRDDVEAAVLDAIGARGWRTAGMVRSRAGADARVTGIAERLVRDGLLAAAGPRGVLGRRRATPPLTRDGRRVLRELRAELPVRGVPAGSSAAEVAVCGPKRMPDAEVRVAVFGPPPRVSRIRRHNYAAGGTAGAGYVGGSSCGGGGASCGGGSSGGGGGASCGGGGGGGCGGGGG